VALMQHQRAVPKPFLSRYRTIKVHHWPWNFIFIAGQPRYLEQADELGTIEDEILKTLGVSALACIPLLAESVVVGAFFVGKTEQPAFEDEERRLLEAIGKAIGAGILRSMLHKRLEAAHREVNLYMDIMTHDIKNAENVSSLYCDLLIDMLRGDPEQYAKKLRGSVRKSTEIIQNVSTIRRIQQTSADLKPVHLGQAVGMEITRYPDAAIQYEDDSTEVWADDLLPEIFTTLFANSVRFGGPNVEIRIRVDDFPEEDHTVLVTVEDTGPGIPDETKEVVFKRFERGKNQGKGSGSTSSGCWWNGTVEGSGWRIEWRDVPTLGSRSSSRCGR
jgi:two-component system sensor histidine kinase KdpD